MSLLSPRYVLVGTWIALVACQAPAPMYTPSAPPEIRDACSLTERRCTACHDRDRFLDARKSRDEWSATIERMRQMPGSTIRPYEAAVILHCLLYRTDMSGLQPYGDGTALASWIEPHGFLAN